MRVYITVTEEPVFINPFLKKVVEGLGDEVVGVGIVSGTVLAGQSVGAKLGYLLALSVISNPFRLAWRAGVTLAFKLMRALPGLKDANFLSLEVFARKRGIRVDRTADPNSEKFLNTLRELAPDVIINQAQAILKKKFLTVPKIATLNRHGALLPKYRGRLAPFWAYLNGESEAGLSIHFVERKLDSGPILVQKRFPIRRFDSADTLINRMFRLAPGAMLEALKMLRAGEYENKLIENDDSQATYCSRPKLGDALRYRLVMLRRILVGK
jgi:folate-dependent phosphoribosylglycinamide formyltransferase PurN